MKYIITGILLSMSLNLSSHASEMKKLGPEHASLGKRLLRLLAPIEETPKTQVNQKEATETSLGGGTNELVNLQVTDSNLTNR